MAEKPRVSPAGLARGLGRRAWAREVGRRLAPIDQRISRAGGRVSVVELTGLPLLRVRVPRRRGDDVEGVVVAARYGEQWLVAGGDDGRPLDHKPVFPAWVVALRATRHAVIVHKGVTRDVRVHRASAEERERWWPLLVRTWPAYEQADRDAAEQWDVWLLTPVS